MSTTYAFQQELMFIVRMLHMQNAYEVYVPEKGVFVCMDVSKYGKKKSIKPIPHFDIKVSLKNADDYVIWMPKKENGWHSPWGYGSPTANLYVLGLYN